MEIPKILKSPLGILIVIVVLLLIFFMFKGDRSSEGFSMKKELKRIEKDYKEIMTEVDS